jgi:GAF domain-containing protein/uncharacterized membrane protein YidH (DUF202 family)
MRARVAWILAGLTLLFVVGDVVMTSAYRPLLSEEAVAEHGFPFTPLAVLGSAVLGAVILSRYQRHAVGVLLNLVGVTSAFSLMTEAYHIWVVSEGGPGPTSLAAVAGWLSGILGGQLAVGALAVMFLLVPDGRFLSGRWRWAAGLIAVGVLVCGLAIASFDPLAYDLEATDVGGIRGPLFSVGFLLIGGGLVASLVSMWIRLRRSHGEERQQLRLISLAVAALVVGLANLLVVQSVNGGGQAWVATLPLFVAYLLLPILFGLATLRYRLYDIEVVIDRTVVLAVGFAFAGIGYTTVVVLVGGLVDTRAGGLWLSLVATAVVALAFQPLRRAVIRLANRIAHGSRAQPYEALSDFSRRLAETPTPLTLLPAVADAAGRAVSARRAVVALHTPDGRVASAATWGEDEPHYATTKHIIPVRNGDVTLGTIQVDVLRGRPLRPSDERLLKALAEQAAIAFRNTAMETQLADHVDALAHTTQELTESRARILEADVEARRELEAAISREVLPQLLAMPDRLRSARIAVATGSPANGLDLLIAGTAEALESLRELTRGVFPTQLTRSGLEPALRSFLARNAAAPAFVVDPSVRGLRFPARVETAVYFCCVEAARLGPERIELGIEEAELVLRIGTMPGPSVDVQQVTDRAEAVGGSVSLDSGVLVLRVPVDPHVASTVEAASSGSGPGR